MGRTPTPRPAGDTVTKVIRLEDSTAGPRVPYQARMALRDCPALVVAAEDPFGEMPLRALVLLPQPGFSEKARDFVAAVEATREHRVFTGHILSEEDAFSCLPCPSHPALEAALTGATAAILPPGYLADLEPLDGPSPLCFYARLESSGVFHLGYPIPTAPHDEETQGLRDIFSQEIPVEILDLWDRALEEEGCADLDALPVG